MHVFAHFKFDLNSFSSSLLVRFCVVREKHWFVLWATHARQEDDRYAEEERQDPVYYNKEEKEACSVSRNWKEELWKEEGVLATNCSVQLCGLHEASKYCNLKWNETEGILGMRKREFCRDKWLTMTLVWAVSQWYFATLGEGWNQERKDVERWKAGQRWQRLV